MNLNKGVRLLPLVAVIGCKSLTDVQAPDVTGIQQLSNIAGADVLRNGAWIRLQYAVDYQTYYGGAIADEFTATFDNDLIDGRGESIIFDPSRGIGNILNYYASWASRHHRDANKC